MIASSACRPAGRGCVLIFCTAGLAAVIGVVGGCGTTLEDGYKPRVIGATPEARKSYYASPFTDSAESRNRGGGGDASPGVRAGPR